jgi:hypothetical protein
MPSSLLIRKSANEAQVSSMIDEELLKLAAPSLSDLRRLTIWGCSRVTRGTLLAILHHAEGIEELSLDALPHTVRRSDECG